MSRSPTGRRLASAWAVLAGFLATFVLSVATDAALHAAGVYPALGVRMSEPLFVLASAYRALYTVVGGYLTARLAPASPMRHAMTLGVFGLAAATGGLVATWNGGEALGPRWYPIFLVVSAIPCIWLGAKAWERWGAGRGLAGAAS